MERGNDALGALLSRLTRPERDSKFSPGKSGSVVELTDNVLSQLPLHRRAEALDRHLRSSGLLAKHPEIHRERILEYKPQLLETARELLSLPTAGDAGKPAAVAIDLLGAQYQIELAALRNGCRKRAPADLLGAYITAALDTLFESLLAYWQCQLPPPGHWWGEAHALYQLACEKDIDAPGQAARDADALVLRAAYLKPQLLGQLNPARFRAAEIRQIAAFLERYADRAQLGKAEGLLCIDPDSSRPPAYFSRQKSPQCWRLCVRGLVDALDLDGGTEALLTPRLQRDLGRYWTKRQVRAELHRRTTQRAVVTIGLEATHQLLTGCEDDDLLQRPLAIDPSAVGSRCCESSLELLCVDRSSAGARFRATEAALDMVLPGTFIGVHFDDEPSFQFGLIRWTRRDGDASLLAGTQWLPPVTQPCAVQRLDRQAVTPVLRAFLSGDPAGGGELFLPAGIFKPADRVQIHTRNGQCSAVLTALHESTFHIARFGIQVQGDHRG